MASSSKLPNKVPDKIIRQRFTQVRQLVNRQLLDRENNRKSKQETGYIVDIEMPLNKNITTKQSNDQTLIIVRPQIHAPEIDPYDEISPNQIISKY
jgi:hypothetical protein